MSNLIVTVSEDNKFFELVNNDKVYIFNNIKEYEEEICEIIETNKMSFNEIKLQVESWGGNVDLVLLKDLVKFYKKNYNQGVTL
tara:strand:+ start:1161 stop:1412 length:252 start_codon:yes stop_codon:yes gene_type:complete